MSVHKIEDLISLDKFKLTLDSVAKATGMNLCVLDVLGNVVIFPCNDAIFCKCARQNPELRQKCLAAASHAAFESARNKKTHFYKCFFGLMDFAVPLFYKGEYLGAICGGSTRADVPTGTLDYLYSELSLDDYPELKKIYDNMPCIEAERYVEMAHLIEKLADYINQFGILMELEEHSSEKGTNLNKLQPALKYIDKHYKDEISVNELASLCYVSTTYFSRLFSRTVGTPLSTYILNLRIKKAKELLQNQGIKIQSVAAEVGYEDPSYFIRKFKQVTGLTPTEYQTMIASDRHTETKLKL